jgi:selenocysteine lyase/cysteine desulfurase
MVCCRDNFCSRVGRLRTGPLGKPGNDRAVRQGRQDGVEPIRALGLADSGGGVRAGFLHYTSEAEVDRLLAALVP